MPQSQKGQDSPIEQLSELCSPPLFMNKNKKLLKLARNEYSRQIIKYTLNQMNHEFSMEERQKCFSLIGGSIYFISL
ncbi:unnamed protein product [Cunninghamella blakesleeana]